MTPRVSVVLPCFNAGGFLPRAFASLRAQTFRDFEIVVVDDGSTEPETLQFLETLPADIRLVRQPNKGLAAARNRGFQEARGSYVLPLDCDDWISPDFLEITVTTLDAHPDVAFVFSDIELHGERSGVLQRSYNPFEQLFLNQLPYCMLMRRRMWETIGGYDDAMRQGYEDWEFNIRASQNGFHGMRAAKARFHYWVSSSGMLHSRSRRLHSQLWSYIQRKHSTVYALAGLRVCWTEWRDRLTAYPLWLYTLLILSHRLLPPSLFNAAFITLFLGFGASQPRSNLGTLVRMVVRDAANGRPGVTDTARPPSQRLVDMTWLLVAASLLLMLRFPVAGMAVNLAAYDVIVPVLLGYLIMRGYVPAPSLRGVLITGGLLALVIVHALATLAFGNPTRPLAVLREGIKLGEAILLTGLFTLLFQNKPFLSPSRSLLLSFVVLIPLWVVGARLLQIKGILVAAETVFAASAAGICTLSAILIYERSRHARGIIFAIGLILTATSYTINSKAFVALGIVMAFTPLIVPYLSLLLTRNPIATGLVLAVGCFVLFALVSVFVEIRASDTSRFWLGSMQSVEASLGVRRVIWGAAWQDLVQSFPWGIGLGQFGMTLQQEEPFVYTYAHNTPLGLVTEMGAMGIAFFGIAALILWQSIRQLNDVAKVLVGAMVVIPMAVHDIQSIRVLHVIFALCLAAHPAKHLAGRGVALSIGSAVFSRISVYAMLLIAAHLLEPDEFGVFAIAMAIGSIVSALVSGGGDLWLNRFTRHQQGLAPNSWAAYLTIATVLAFVVVSLSGGVLLTLDPPGEYGAVFFLVIVGASISGIAESGLAIIRASGRVGMFFAIRDIAVPLFFLSLVISAKPSKALDIVWIYTSIWLAALITVGAFLYLNARRLLPAARARYRRLLRPAFVHTIGLVYGNLGSRITSSLDTLVLSVLLSLADTGAYRVVAQCSVGFVVIQHFIFLGLPWQLGRSVKNPLNATALNEVVNRQKLLLSLSALGLAFLLVAADSLLALVGPQFVVFSRIFSLLLILRFIELTWGPQHELLVSHGRVILDAHANLLAIISWGITFLFLITAHPYVPSAVAATGVASLVAQGTRSIFLSRIGLPHLYGHPFGVYLPILGTAAVIAASLWHWQF